MHRDRRTIRSLVIEFDSPWVGASGGSKAEIP
jgi:hypothetical protein